MILAKYTVLVKDICSSLAKFTCPIDYSQINMAISGSLDQIFDEDLKNLLKNYDIIKLEEDILRHYFMCEIGLETYSLWRFYLNDRLREILPYYDELFATVGMIDNPLENQGNTKTITRNKDENRTGSSDTEGNGTTSNSGESKNKNRFSDTPQGHIYDEDNAEYLTTITWDDGSSSNSGTSTNKVTESNSSHGDEWENVVERNNGFTGSQATLLKEYRETIINIERMVIEELSDLFMSLC